MTAHFGMKVITDLLQDFLDSYGVRFQMTVAVRSFRNDGHRTVISEGRWMTLIPERKLDFS